MFRLRRSTWVVLGLSFLLIGGRSSAETVYQNGDWGTIGIPHSFINLEAGDQITLAGSCRAVANIELTLANLVVPNTVSVRVRLYANDGRVSPLVAAGNEPGTELFDSGAMTVALQPTAAPFVGSFNVSFAPPLVVPDTFTWTIQRLDGPLQQERIGPPSVGSSSDYIWQHDPNGWSPQKPAVASNSFYAVVSAVGGSATITCPADVAVQCGSDTSPLATGEAIASGCGAVTVTYADASLAGCGGTETITRTWSADDGSGTPMTCAQVISVWDTSPPELTGVPAGLTIECGSIPPPASPVATDVCSPGGTVAFGEVASGTCGNVTITRSWAAADACGNQTIASQLIQVVDATAPVAVADLVLISEGDEEGTDHHHGHHDDDEGRFQIVASCSDNCDGSAGCGLVTAVAELRCVGGGVVAVVSGEIVEIEIDDEECEIEVEDNEIEIEGDVTLVVTCTDASGNTSQATAVPVGLALDNDDESEVDD